MTIKEQQWREEFEQRVGDRRLELEQIQLKLSEQKPKRPLAPKLKMPELQPSEDIEDFLAHFDAVSDKYQLSEDDRILYLSGSLTGQAREAFLDMPEQATYADLKVALLKRFRLGPEAYRRKFRELTKKSDETFIHYGQRIIRTFDHWVALSGLSERDAILFEKLILTVSEDLATRLRERRPKTFKEALEIAETYAEARRGRTTPSDWGQTTSPTTSPKRGGRRTPNRSPRKVAPHAPTFGSSRGPRGGNLHPVSTSPRGGGGQGAGPGVRSEFRPAVRNPSGCYYCGEPGHFKRECPALFRDQGHTPVSRAQASACTVGPPRSNSASGEDGGVPDMTTRPPEDGAYDGEARRLRRTIWSRNCLRNLCR